MEKKTTTMQIQPTGISVNTPNSIEAIKERLSSTELKVCDLVNLYNQLRSFPLTAIEILEWKDSLMELLRGMDTDTAKIEFAIKKMISGELEFDSRLGIQNIFNAYRNCFQDDKGQCRIKNFTW